MTTVDLSRYTSDGKVHNLADKERGLFARKEFELDRLDASSEVVDVVIPDHVYAISTSFFCGLFADSYDRLGRDGLLAKYNFVVPDMLWHQIEQGLERCSTEFEPFMATAV